MIEINLMPDELKRQSRKIKRPQIDISKLPFNLKQLAIFVAVAFAVFHLLAAAIFFFKLMSLKGIDKNLNRLEPKYKVAQALKLEVNYLNSKLSAINELMSKSILWSKKMADLNSAVSDGIWLNELSLQDEKGPKKQQAMTLKGSVVSYPEREEAALIGNFINSLKSNKGFYEDFSDIKLVSSQMRKVSDLEVMDFAIICYFKEGRSYFDKSHKR